MPRRVHMKLARRARRLHLTGKRRRAYIYGTLARIKKRRRLKRRRRR